ncbi:MAG: ead/Ea22-like family protein [Hyphomicrobium sp.]|jgi:crotonobetainyl-CoA:carnitine CoA-transferase CaiB-like acyl-CoA transferase
MIDEQKMRELAEAATPGPWEVEQKPNGYVQAVGPLRADEYCGSSWVECFEADADYVSAVDPQTILALLDELQNLRNDRDSWSEQCSQRVQDAVDAYEKLEAMTQERTEWRVTAENAEAAVKQARIDALEEARKHCDELSGFLLGHQDRMGANLIVSVRDSIESLKGKTP